MQLKKSIIALLFLFTYLVGFTHNLAPHSEAFFEETHNTLENKALTHIDYSSEGFYNYLICVMNEINHSEQKHSIEHQFSFNNNNLSLSDVGQVQFVSVLITFFIPINQQVAYSKCTQDKDETYRPPLLVNSPFRGPPSFSC